MAQQRLPSFDRAPVVETVLGVQFDLLQPLTNAHLGVFWKGLGAAWADVSDAPSLDPVFERFGAESAWGRSGFQFKFTQDPACRLRIRNAAQDRMIQIQNGRLHYNWLKQRDGVYPRYEETIRPEFDRMLGTLRSFLDSESLGELRPNQWEITYVNHIPRGTVWNEPADWMELFAALTGPTAGPQTVRLESFGGHWHYEIPPQRGRLHVELQHGRPSERDNPEHLVMKLTARGPVDTDGRNGLSLEEGLDLGHEAIVLAFKELTSPSAHRYWKIRNGND